MQRFIGGILLVSGTSIGAGMLALPVVSSFGGFFPSLFFLFICWLFLFTTSLFFLDVNLSFKEEVNFITMANQTLGWAGKAVCWGTYLLLLYSLTAAYIAGSAPLFIEMVEFFTGILLPSWAGPFPLLLLFGLFVYLGTNVVDWVNRLLMFGLVFTYVFLASFLPAEVTPSLLSHVDFKAAWIAIPVFITSFGFHIIIPTLCTYLNHDKRKLKQVLLIGSLIPLFVYLLWEFLILGVVPLSGDGGLVSAYLNGSTAVSSLSQILQTGWITNLAKSFSFFAILTSFLGVSLSLSDFLTDGFHMHRFSLGRELACLLTFLPPLGFVLIYPKGFILALQFAGIFVVILLCILPALMVWKLANYRSFLKKALLISVLAFSLGIIVLDLLEESGQLQSLTAKYIQH